MKNLYETLGVREEATLEEIRKAYRELAKQTHPDSGGDPERFREVNHAWNILSRPESRQDYDRALADYRARKGDFSSYAPPEYQVDARNLQKLLKELIRQGNLTRVRIKRKGKVLVDMPLTAATALTTLGFIFAPIPTLLMNVGIYRYLEMEVINPVAEEYEKALEAHQAGRFAEAIGRYGECVGLSEYFVPAHVNLGMLYRQLGENRKAIASFRKVLEIAPFGELGAIARTNLRELQGF
ncbi:MAG: DnaJ domain-containing protein [bacterium]